MKKNILLVALLMSQTVPALFAAENNMSDEAINSLSVISEKPNQANTNMGDEAPWEEMVSETLEKVLENVKEGSRIAINQIQVIGYPASDKKVFKDMLVDLLIEKGYKVVAKEYLEKLYEEQQAQQSGIYNDKTTVKTNNFSAAGYYINLKINANNWTERVQIINVSTGEIEGSGTCEYGVGGYTCR